jgi:phosphatidylethanolamine-binding protein (PEBP) family uncharacterized protein
MKLKIKKTFRRKHRNTKHRTRRNQKGSAHTLQVFYGDTQVSGQELPKNRTQTPPSIRFPTTGKLYTLVMWDPDVPPQAQPGFVHWIATNLQSHTDIKNNQVLPYKGPAPPSGIHRYFFGLFEQPGHISLKQPERQNFSIDNLIGDNHLIRILEVYMKVKNI